MSEYVRLEVAEGIGTIRIDRPKMNPLNGAIQDTIAELATEADGRDDIAAVIVYGGEKVFAAGADIKEMQEMTYAQMSLRAPKIGAFTAAVAAIGKPTVAAIEGYALGGGCELALACDFRVAGSNAKLGQPEIMLGIIPGAGGTQRLPRLVGPARAKELIFSGRQIDAEEALRIGLIDRICDPGTAYEAALKLVKRYVGGPAQALRLAKSAVDQGLEVDLATGMAIEAMQFSGTFATADQKIGMTSFVEQGPGKAAFTGR